MARQPVLQRLALFGRHRYRRIFIASLLAVIGSGLLASRLKLDTDFLNLLPKHSQEVNTFRDTLQEFGSLDLLLVVVRVPEGVTVDPYETFVDRLGERLGTLDTVDRTEYKIGELEELLETVFPQALFFLDDAGRESVAEQLTDEGLHDRAREIKRILATPQALLMKSLIRFDPLGLSSVLLGRIESSRAGLDIDWASGYFLSQDHRMLLLLAWPTQPPQDIEFCQRLATEVEGEIAALKAQWSEIAGPGTTPPEVQVAGRYLIALTDANLIRNDVIINIVTSMLGVLLLFLFAFRRFGPLLYAFVPLCVGLAFTFGFSYLAFGTLNSATSGVAALLIGLGIDFVIVSYGRYVEERQRGSGLEVALARMSGSSGRAVVVGGVTSAATFYAFGVTDFTGLRQMGFLTGTGILFCMIAVLLLLPAMLAWSEDRHHRRESTPRLFLHGFGTGRIIRASLANPWPVMTVGVLITLAAAISATTLRFEDSVKAMRPPDSESVNLRDEVAQRFGSGFDSMMLVIDAESVGEVLDLVQQAADGAQEMVTAGVLTGYDAVTRILPPPIQQRQALEWLAGERSGRLDTARIRGTFEAALATEGLRPEALAEGLDLAGEALSPERLIDIEALVRSPTTGPLLKRYLRQTDSGWRSVVYLHPPPEVWRREPPPQARRLADELGPGAELTGANVVSSFLRREILRDALVAGCVGVVLVALLLWTDYRRWLNTLLSMSPLVFGILWMLGAMAALGMTMNFMNIFVSTMIIGIGVDYGVHMIHRYRELGDADWVTLEIGLSETGKAIVLAALSTIMGFGSLSLSHYPGLRSMGLVAILGALSTCLVAITLLPAYLSLRFRRRAKAERPGLEST